MVKTYKCPACGAPMVFEPVSQKLVCGHCGTMITSEEAKNNTVSEADINTEPDALEQDENGTGDRLDFKVYNCPSCGAEILTDKYTTATICSFCGTPGLMEDRIEGILRPSYIIPFSIDKKNAVDIFKKWTGLGLLTPSDFKSQNTIEKMVGMYVPYWLYDYDVFVDMNANCTKTTHSVSGKYEYTYTHHYSVLRSANGRYEKVPADASEELDDNMMDLLEPFNYSSMIDFDESYLSGYQSERYNFNDTELQNRVVKRITEYAEEIVRNSITGYDSVHISRKNVNTRKYVSKYALLPVWILNYRYLGKNHMIVINGQTGKLVGKLPFSKGKAAMWFGLAASIVFFIMSFFSIIMS